MELLTAQDFTISVAAGLLFAAWIMAVGMFLYEFCWKEGVAKAHFKWAESGRKSLRRSLPWLILGLLVLLISLLLPAPLLRFYLTRNVAEAGQGRHILFPAAAAVSLLLILGLSAWFPPNWHRSEWRPPG